MSDIEVSWVEEALNGSSFRFAHLWTPEPGDMLAGTVTERGESMSRWGLATYLSVKVEVGTLAGQPLAPGSWYRVYAAPAVLKRWLERDQPQIGDRVALRYWGLLVTGDRRAHKFECGCVKAERVWDEAPQQWS